jgi:plastocyanin
MAQRPVHPVRIRTPRQVTAFLCAAAWSVTVVSLAWGGAIKGTVRYAGAPVAPKKILVTTDQYVCGREKDAEEILLSPDKGIRNVVVWLQNPPAGAKWEAPPSPPQMDQSQCVFVPRVVLVPAGGTVEFLNNDRLLHNLHSRAPTENPAFNRTQPKGRTIPIVFKKPEIIRVDCDLHPWMRAWVVVAEHPFYAVTGDQGEFSLKNVPAGQYTLQLWQETLGTVTKAVTVGDADVTTTLEIGRP